VGRYVDIHGHPTWVEIVGQGSDSQTAMLLHGGLSNGEELLDAIGQQLAATYRVIAFDGHGRTADTDAPFHFSDMTTPSGQRTEPTSSSLRKSVNPSSAVS
jgi:hypothetical protein